MNEARVAEVLAAHAEALSGRPEAVQQVNLTDEELSRLAPLFQLAKRLQQGMQPTQPSADFMRSLGQEMMDGAKRQITLTRRLRRALVIGAAALGSLLSVASLVGAAVFLIARLRARAQARGAHAPTG